MVDKEKIKRLSNKYNFQCKVFYDTIYITSKYDEWVAEIVKENVISLKHVNNGRGGNNKNWTHLQRRYTDFEFMFYSINQHDDYKEKNVVRM